MMLVVSVALRATGPNLITLFAAMLNPYGSIATCCAAPVGNRHINRFFPPDVSAYSFHPALGALGAPPEALLRERYPLATETTIPPLITFTKLWVLEAPGSRIIPV